jgi:plasmid stability protein
MSTLTLRNLSPRLMEDIKAWARMRRKSQEAAAVELLRIGLDVTSERAQAESKRALDIIQRVRDRR